MSGHSADAAYEREFVKAAEAQPYRITTRYAVGDVIEHPTFGRGHVESIEDKKMKVRFGRKVTVLAHAEA